MIIREGKEGGARLVPLDFFFEGSSWVFDFSMIISYDKLSTSPITPLFHHKSNATNGKQFVSRFAQNYLICEAENKLKSTVVCNGGLQKSPIYHYAL